MKFLHLIDYNMRNIFLQKLYPKCSIETSPRHFSEKWKLSISLDQLAKVSDTVFLMYAKLRAVKIIETMAAYYLHFPHLKLS